LEKKFGNIFFLVFTRGGQLSRGAIIRQLRVIDTIIKLSVLLFDISSKNFNVLENLFSDNMWCKDSEFMNEVHNQI